jgi:UDP-N-acetylmuramate dehydrogenase
MKKEKGVEAAAKELKKAGIGFKKNYPVKKHSNFRIGGKAALFIEIKKAKELAPALKILKKSGIKFMAIGNMTNLLIRDGKLNMAFLRLSGAFKAMKMKSGRIVHAGAAVDNNGLLNFLVKNGFGGLEFLAGIPGTLGGAIYMNAGAYGKGIGSFTRKVYFTGKDGKPRKISGKAAGFAYRKSIFQKNGAIITGADLAVVKKDRKESAAEMREIIQGRRDRHPWDAACAGSFFKNSPDITAGKLIEMAGLKGLTIGGAQVSKKHANFLINKGGASFSNVIRLAEKVKREVYRKFKIRLKEEVIIIK